MNTILTTMLQAPERSTAYGGVAGFAVAFILWLIQQVFKAAWNFDLIVPDWIMVGGPVAIAVLVQHVVRDRYKAGEPDLALTSTERAKQAPPPTT